MADYGGQRNDLWLKYCLNEKINSIQSIVSNINIVNSNGLSVMAVKAVCVCNIVAVNLQYDIQWPANEIIYRRSEKWRKWLMKMA